MFFRISSLVKNQFKTNMMNEKQVKSVTPIVTMNKLVSILESAAAVVFALAKVDRDSNQFTAKMAMCKKHDSDDDNKDSDVGGPGRGNAISGVKANYMQA